jgi:hypothetical protein
MQGKAKQATLSGRRAAMWSNDDACSHTSFTVYDIWNGNSKRDSY